MISTIAVNRSFPFAAHFVHRFSSSSSAKKLLKGYKLREITREECEEQHVRGWGPGGSCVNAAGNAVVLRHKATNCAVKVCFFGLTYFKGFDRQVHESRKLHKNVQIAYDRLKVGWGDY